MKILAIVNFNQGIAYVLDEYPRFIYEKHGGLLIGSDQSGVFYNCLIYSPPSPGFYAFAGRKFDILLKTGGTVHCYGQYWDGGADRASEILGTELIPVAVQEAGALRECYVFRGMSADKEKLQRLVSEYKGPIYGYKEYKEILNRTKAEGESADG